MECIVWKKLGKKCIKMVKIGGEKTKGPSLLPHLAFPLNIPRTVASLGLLLAMPILPYPL